MDDLEGELQGRMKNEKNASNQKGLLARRLWHRDCIKTTAQRGSSRSKVEIKMRGNKMEFSSSLLLLKLRLNAASISLSMFRVKAHVRVFLFSSLQQQHNPFGASILNSFPLTSSRPHNSIMYRLRIDAQAKNNVKAHRTKPRTESTIA